MDSNDILRIRCIQQVLIGVYCIFLCIIDDYFFLKISNMTKTITSSDGSEIVWPTVKFLFFHAYFETNDNFKSDDENVCLL